MVGLWISSAGRRSGGYVNDATIAGGAAERDAALFPIPHHGGDRALAGSPQEHFLLVGEARSQNHAVLVADGHHLLAGVAGDARHHGITARAEFQRRLAHWPVLGMKRPDDGSRRAGTGQPAAPDRPGEAFYLGRIAGHAHVLAVGKLPGWQRILLSTEK